MLNFLDKFYHFNWSTIDPFFPQKLEHQNRTGNADCKSAYSESEHHSSPIGLLPLFQNVMLSH